MQKKIELEIVTKSNNYKIEYNSPGLRRVHVTIAVITIVTVGTEFSITIPLSPPRIPPITAVILNPHQYNMNKTLQRISNDPNADRHVRMLVNGERKHHRRYHNERHIPRHVKRYNWLRVSPIGTTLFEFTRRRFAYKDGRSSPSGGASEKLSEGSTAAAAVAFMV